MLNVQWRLVIAITENVIIWFRRSIWQWPALQSITQKTLQSNLSLIRLFWPKVIILTGVYWIKQNLNWYYLQERQKPKVWNKYEIFIFRFDSKFLSFYCKNLKSLSLKFKVQICANIYPQFSVILIKESRLPFISWRWWKLRWENI
jgi:hypothetical protein